MITAVSFNPDPFANLLKGAFHDVYGIKPSDYFSLNEAIFW